MREGYEIVIKLLSRRKGALYQVVDEGVFGDLVATNFKKCEISGYLNE